MSGIADVYKWGPLHGVVSAPLVFPVSSASAVCALSLQTQEAAAAGAKALTSIVTRRGVARGWDTRLGMESLWVPIPVRAAYSLPIPLLNLVLVRPCRRFISLLACFHVYGVVWCFFL